MMSFTSAFQISKSVNLMLSLKFLNSFSTLIEKAEFKIDYMLSAYLSLCLYVILYVIKTMRIIHLWE